MSELFQKTIIIIGAGVSGLSAARRLLEFGFKNVRIFEATDVIGGRIATSALGNGWVEIGAQWIHGENDNIVHKTAQQHNLLLTKNIDELWGNHFYNEDGNRIDEDIVDKVFSALDNSLDRKKLKVLNELHQIMSIDELLNKKMENLIDELSPTAAVECEMNALLKWFKALQSSIEGCDCLSQLSTTSFMGYRECEGNCLTNFKNGYRSLINVVASGIPSSLVHLNKSVKEINLLTNGQGARITCTDSTVNDADHVIVTVSLGYLKEHAHELFKPALPPAKLQTIEKLGFGTVNKIFLEFESPFWPSSCTGYNLAWKDADKFDHPDHKWGEKIFGFYTVPFASNVLCGWITGPEARYMESLTDSEVKATSLYLLKRFTGIKNLPSVKSFIRSKWNSHPFMRGSYSFLNTQQICNEELAKPIYGQYEGTEVPVILFAGEATHPYYYSTVHGAMNTGMREADRIIELYSRRNISQSKL